MNEHKFWERVREANRRPLNQLCRKIQEKAGLEPNPYDLAFVDLALEGDSEQGAQKMEDETGLKGCERLVGELDDVDPVLLTELIEREVDLKHLEALSPQESAKLLREVLATRLPLESQDL